ncbi:MAG: methylenetetrahydrofolate reductase C-terminal domain-containing protein [Syntrophorhabdaceae bacterium]|nr:methylenetetrahydrofolate reductase C-terminal domain-containing protein [Syntrophorhabdaceae bacterium]
MITGKLKPFEEIYASIEKFKNILVVGCGTCVSVCLSGGDREAQILGKEIMSRKDEKCPERIVNIKTIQRQCEKDFITDFFEVPEGTDAILSLACGAGVQTVAEVFKDLPVLPALNTTFLGALDEYGLWREKCHGCGSCLLAHTGGICPIARCAKSIMNGPCGGSTNGKCEIGNGIDCAWQLIIDRLKALGRLDEYGKIFPFKDWSTDRGSGPRSMQRTANDPFQEAN